MKRPNFFLLGAPKCGTTSMADWLSEHPQVFMSTPKEPTFFCTDLIPDRRRNLGEYEALFADAGAEHRVVGEASTGYLFSRSAVPEILAYADDPRFMVMLRNPIEMAHALHGEQLFQGNERVRDFETAWALQERRARDPADPSIPATCRDPQLLLYGPFCRTGEQLERLYGLVPRERVHVVLLDDAKRDPRSTWRTTLAFLGLDDDGRREFPVRNVAKARRSSMLAGLTRRLGALRARLGPTYRGFGVLNRLADWNRRKQAREPLSPQVREDLADYFGDDVERLGRLLGRDLGGWLAAP